MDDIISDSEIRRERATQRIGRDSQCAVCPEHDPRCLELHHIAGQAHHDDLVPVCRNCHRKLSDSQRDHAAARDLANAPLEVIGHYLMGLADLFVLLANRLAEFGKTLIELASAPLPTSDESKS